MNNTVYIEKYDNTSIQIVTEDYNYLYGCKEYFSDYVDGFLYSPKYKMGIWNGKVCLMNWNNKTLPYGLLTDVLSFHKKKFPDHNITISDNVKALLRGHPIDIQYNLSIQPRDYQKECIESCLKFSKGIIVSATASGKSLIIAYIIKNLMDNHISNKSLIIVPTIGLVKQFESDLISYGFDSNMIGKVFSKEKNFSSPITISTWQSLSRDYDKLKMFDAVICDEVHNTRGYEVRKVMRHTTNATYRLGFTGTMPTSNVEVWNVKSYTGPVLKVYGPGQLSEQGYISKCNIIVKNLHYNKEYIGDYNTVKDNVFSNPFRLGVIRKIIESIDGNILILVGKVEKEGKILKEYLDCCESLKDRDIIFMWGGTDVDTREYWRRECETRKNIVIIATYGIFSVGANIPSLKYLILGSPFKSKIRILQSIGRTLRLHADKYDGAYTFDIADDVRYLEEHSLKRFRYYEMERFNITEEDCFEDETSYQSILLINQS